MSFLKLTVWPVVAGFIVASIVMMILEYINSYLFPFPENFSWSDQDAVAAFTASLPWTAYILVVLGWAFGSFKGGWVATYLAGDTKYRAALYLGIVLTLAGIANALMIGHNMLFTTLTLPIFILFTYVGHCVALEKWPRMFFRSREAADASGPVV